MTDDCSYNDTLFHETDSEFTYWYASEADEWRADADDAIDEGDAYINTGLNSAAYRGMSVEQAKQVRDELTRLIEYLESEGYSVIDPRELRVGMEVDMENLPRSEMSPTGKHEKGEWVDDDTLAASYTIEGVTLVVEYEPVGGESAFEWNGKSDVVVTDIKQIEDDASLSDIDMDSVF